MDRFVRCAALAALMCALAACGGSPSSGSAAASPSGGASGPQISGVTTPPNVSVVTAKNAQ